MDNGFFFIFVSGVISPYLCNVVPKSCIVGEIFQATQYPISCSGPLYELPKLVDAEPKGLKNIYRNGYG